MASVTTVKMIDVTLLSSEVGAPVDMSAGDPPWTVTADVPQDDLEAKVAAHVSPDSPDQKAASDRADLQAQLDQLSDLVTGI